MKNFVVKLSVHERAESARYRVVKVLMTAVGYTDAEKTCIEVFEKKFREEYRNPSVLSISPEAFNLTHDSLESSEDAEYSRVYRLKLAVTFKGEEAKRITKILLIRTDGIESAIKAGEQVVKEYYDAETVEVIEAKETDLYPESPIFDKDEDDSLLHLAAKAKFDDEDGMDLATENEEVLEKLGAKPKRPKK